MATTWTASDPTWARLTDAQKAAVMSLMEAGTNNVEDARHAAGAMVNRSSLSGVPLGKHVSGAIYQPTIEESQHSRLAKILSSPQFGDMTDWVSQRQAGQVPDPVNGATHFLAHPKVMLSLESQNPSKYKNWGPRGANWTGYDPNTGQYSGQVFADKSHAFLIPKEMQALGAKPTGDYGGEMTAAASAPDPSADIEATRARRGMATALAQPSTGVTVLAPPAAAPAASGDLTPPDPSRSALARALIEGALASKSNTWQGAIGDLLGMYAGARGQAAAHTDEQAYNAKVANAIQSGGNNPDALRAILARIAPAKALEMAIAPKVTDKIIEVNDPENPGEKLSAVQHPDNSIQLLNPRAMGQSGGASPHGSSSIPDGVIPQSVRTFPVGSAVQPQGSAQQSMFGEKGTPAPNPLYTVPEPPVGVNRKEWKQKQADQIAKEQGDLREKAVGSLTYLSDAGPIYKQVSGYDPAVFTPGYASETRRDLGAWLPDLGLTNVGRNTQQRNQLEANVGRLATSYAKANFGSRVTNADLAMAKSTFGISPSADRDTVLNLLDQRAREAHQNVARGIAAGIISPSEIPSEHVAEGLRMGVYKPEWFPQSGETPSTSAQVQGGKGAAQPAPIPQNPIGSALPQQSTPAQPAVAPQGAAPQIGAIEDGHRFKGGNPADPASWEAVR